MRELIIPQRCAGCGAGGEILCHRCAEELRTPPQRVFTRVAVHAPVFAFSTYSGAHRSVVLAMKEKNNLAVRRHVAAVVAAGIAYLSARGEIPHTVTLVPAPTRRRSARLRGGDPVAQMCTLSGLPVAEVLHLTAGSRDQSELSASERRHNVAHSVQVTARPVGDVVVVDDVVTTGATLAAAIAALRGRGARVVGALALCYA